MANSTDTSSLDRRHHILVEGVRLPNTEFVYTDPNFAADLKRFQTRKDDVFIASYPKSGNTWTCEILWQIYNDGASSDVNISNRVYWFDVHPLLRRSEPKQSESSPNPKPVIELLPSPRLLKSHLPYHVIPKGQDEATACKYIYVARNPKDAATSLYHFYQTIPGVMEDDISLETMVQIFLQGTVPYNLWSDHVLGWWKHKDDPNILFLKYEDMNKDLLSAVKAIAEFVQKPLSEEVIQRIVHQCSIREMAKNSDSVYRVFPEMTGPTFIRKGEVGDWKNHFPPEMNEKFEAEFIEKMKEHGLEFD